MPPIEVTPDGYQPSRWGQGFLYFCVAFLFVLFVMRFWYLQMLKGEEFARLSYANKTRNEQVYAPRGIIVDARGNLLAENRPAFCLAIIREDCPDIAATLAEVSRWTGVPLDSVQDKFRQDISRVRSFEPQLLVTDIPFEQVATIEQELHQWPGISIVTRQRRFYPQGDLFAHIMGYVAEANPAEISADSSLTLGDIVGKQGIEVKFEKRLRGAKGRNLVEVDVLGRQLRKNQEQPSQAGENITLSLDIELQKAAVEALGEESGCVVVMEPDTGKIRALVTTPSYDNNLFTTKLSQRDWDALSNHPRHPLQNRAIQSTYPPGSVWKLMMVGLLLEQGISPRESVFCGGSVTLGSHVFRCWRAGGHGTVGMMQALVVSCDVYFYEMAQKVGIDNLERYAKLCGFGKGTGIDLPHEKGGLVPGRAWKLARFNEPWQRGETLNSSIGQGFTLVTPVQMAVFVSALLNGGSLLKPSLIEDEPAEVRGVLPMTAAHRDFIKEAMRLTAETGTARKVYRADAVMGGKTGTAQVVKIGEKRLKKSEMAYQHRDHAWISTWGMKDGKSYTVIVMVEHGGGGSATAGPIARSVFDHLFGPEAASNTYRAAQ